MYWMQDNPCMPHVFPFPPITSQQAIEIARRHCGIEESDYERYICRSRPTRGAPYMPNGMPSDPCWYVSAPWGDGKLMLRSSRVILISRVTGEICYDGSARDEG